MRFTAPEQRKVKLALGAVRMAKVGPRSEFAKNVLTLMTGTGIAQVLPVLFMPILARLYSETQFGLLNLFTRIVSPLGVLVSGRYELAIMLPEEDEDAVNIFAVSALLSTVASLILLLGIVLFHGQIVALLESPAIGPWLYLVPMMLITNAAYQSFNYWFNRKQQYARLARNKVTRSTLTLFGKAALGFQKVVGGGLILGEVLGQGIATYLFFRQARREDAHRFREIRFDRMRHMMKRYSDFPKFSVPADLVNAVSLSLPTFFLNAAFGDKVLGRFGFTQMIFAAPLAVVAAAFADVFKQRASIAFVEHGECRALWTNTAKRLLAVSIPLFALLYLTAPYIVPLIFGQRWVQAVPFIQALTPYYLLAFIASPLSRTLIVAEKQRWDLVWQLVLLLFVAITLTNGVRTHDPVYTMETYGWVYASMYAVYLVMSYRCACGRGAQTA